MYICSSKRSFTKLRIGIWFDNSRTIPIRLVNLRLDQNRKNSTGKYSDSETDRFGKVVTTVKLSTKLVSQSQTKFEQQTLTVKSMTIIESRVATENDLIIRNTVTFLIAESYWVLVYRPGAFTVARLRLLTFVLSSNSCLHTVKLTGAHCQLRSESSHLSVKIF